MNCKARTLLPLLLLPVLFLSAQTKKTGFAAIHDAFQRKNYFEARDHYQQYRSSLNDAERNYSEAVLENVFNRHTISDQRLNALLTSRHRLPDSLLYKTWQIRADNAVKTFQYKKAEEAVAHLLQQYKTKMRPEEIRSAENEIKIWKALAGQPAQTITFNGDTRLRFVPDKAGLKNLPVVSGSDTTDFIFDTGANFSTTTLSTAKQLGMLLLPADFEVGSITGEMVPAQLALCPSLHIGNMELKQVVFLVFADSDLYIPQIQYQIKGILGYPAIAAMQEIRITRDGWFSVAMQKEKGPVVSNMAMDGLTPLLNIGGAPYTFDTGADKTILYAAYYKAQRQEIDKKYKPSMIHFGGAGGSTTVPGFTVPFRAKIGDAVIVLPGISLLKEPVESRRYIFGNIGQDLIASFARMTLNFEKMFIRFSN